MVKKLLITILALSALIASAKTGPAFIALADGHKVYYETKNWDYALSEKTFQKTMPLIEHRSISGLRGVFENEVRFISKRSPASAMTLLKAECDKAKKFYTEDNYQVFMKDNVCIVQTSESHTLPRSMYQVIEAKISRSRSDMLFFYTWTFHFPKKVSVDSVNEIDAILGLQGGRS